MDVLQHLLAAGIGLRELLHGVDVLRCGHDAVFRARVICFYVARKGAVVTWNEMQIRHTYRKSNSTKPFTD